jgi:hypothetical protein
MYAMQEFRRLRNSELLFFYYYESSATMFSIGSWAEKIENGLSGNKFD